MIIFSVVLAFSTIVFLIIIYRRLQTTRKQKVVIEEQKEEVESQRDEIERQKEIVDEKNDEITSSISYAERIQNALLANKDTWSQIGKEQLIFFKPRDIVSGDFYWAYTDDEYSIWVAADCTGHGVPGAFMSVLGMGFLHQIIFENQEFKADEILNDLRAKIIGSLEQKYSDLQQKDGMDVALCVFNKKSMTLDFAGANNPLYIIRDNEIMIIKGDKMPVGKYQEGEEKSFSSETIKVNHGDVIYSFSDGFADQFGGVKNKKYGYKTFRNLLIENHQLPMSQQTDILDREFNQWVESGEDDQIDDVCIVGIKV